ncbi:MAG: RNA polymerase sigma factor [Solirubrobacteraceae bacterium]
MIAASLARPEAFAAIFDRHYGAVHAYLSRRIGAGKADDLASATFTVAFERRAEFRAGVSSARPWLFGIATNLLRNDWHAQQRALAALARFEAASGDPAGATGDAGAGGSEVLARVLAELDPGQRDVLLLYAWEGFSYEEIATSLGVRIGTVRSRLARARDRLRAALAAAERPGSPTGVEGQEMVE